MDKFFRRRLGDNVADNLVSAMVHGIYAADSREMSVRSTFWRLWDAEKKWGSLVLGAIGGVKSKAELVAEKREWEELGELGKEREEWSLYGLQGGLGTLVNRLGDEARRRGVEVRLGEVANSIELGRNGITVRVIIVHPRKSYPGSAACSPSARS